MDFGNTPLVKINYIYKEKIDYIYAKLEFYNITGSIKDRVAYYIINNAYKNKELRKGMEIVEATSGNTGIALAALGRRYGNKVTIFMPDWVSRERISLLKMFGAKVILISKFDGGFKNAVNLAKKYAIENDAFYANQFENYNNVLAHYETTGKEIVSKLGDKIGGFVSGVDTGGTLIGTGKRLKEFDSKIKLFALEPENMQLISGGKIMKNHKIEGISDEFLPSIFDENMIDDVIVLDENDAINMARKIAKYLGIGVGISSGANLLASILVKEKCSKDVVTIFVDDNKKYLSTDLVKNIDLNPNFISNSVKLLNWRLESSI